jgi:hypothetical protein
MKLIKFVKIKKIIFMIIIMILITAVNCTVNENTGLIRIENKSVSPIKNVKIGNTFILSYLAGGANYDYWYYSNIEGKLTLEGIDLRKLQQNLTLKLKTGYWVYITASYDKYIRDDEVYLSVYDKDNTQLDSSEWTK